MRQSSTYSNVVAAEDSVTTGVAISKEIRRPKRGCLAWCRTRHPPRPVHGQWGGWTPLNRCSKTCGGGTQTFQRYCNSPAPQHGGSPCTGTNVLANQICNGHINCPVHGGWSTWEEEDVCKESRISTERLFCGKGVRKQTRTCTEPRAEFGGLSCEGISSQHLECGAGNCPGCFRPPVPLGVEYFTDDGRVTASDPTVATTPSDPTDEDLSPTEATPKSKLPELIDSLATIKPSSSTALATVSPKPTRTGFDHNDVLSFGCLDGFSFQEPPPVDAPFHTLKCTIGEWKGVTPVCNDINECTDGVHGCDPVRANCTNINGGFKCYCKEAYEKNEEGECEGVPVDGRWGSWLRSGICSKTCSGGLMRFERLCNSPYPKYGGRLCQGEDYKYEPCNTQCCPVHGVWSEWITGPCSKTCGNGTRDRDRYCIGPYCGGDDCPLIDWDSETAACYERTCQCCPIPALSPGVEYTIRDDDYCDIKKSMNHDVPLQYTCGDGYYKSVFDNDTRASSYIKCAAGIWEGDSPECKDMNECDLNIHECNPETSICVNTLGSYKCYCKNGFKMAADGKTCEDSDECEDNNGACKEHCRNDFGSYQCYCPDDFELAEDGLSCLHPSSECPDLPTPKNASKTCTKVTYGLTCDLVCHEDFEFSGTNDPSPQTCGDGVWSYQRREKEMPDCEAIQDSWLSFDTFLDDQGDCDPSSEYNTDPGSLLDYFPGGGPSSANAECSSTGGKRSTGSLRLAVRLAVRVTPSCLKISACRNWYLRVLYSKAIQLRNVISKGTTQVTVTNKHTQETKAVTLSGYVDLRKAKLGIACNPGSVVVGQNCVKCSRGYFYSDAGKCEPCTLHTYQNGTGQLFCVNCSSGTYTTIEGSKSAESCLAPCPAGSYSATGLEPCKQCPYGSYQNSSGKNFCYLCSFQLNTTEGGSTNKHQCECPENRYWQGCSRNCTCLNGGHCRIDGKCDCPRGWTGTDCSNPKSISSQCQDTYMVALFDNYRSRSPRHIIVLTANHKADVDAFVGDSSNHSVVDSAGYEVDSHTSLPIEIETHPYIYQLLLYPADRSAIIGYNSERRSADAFMALPLQGLSENENEIFLTISAGATDNSKLSSVVLVVASRDNTSVEITTTRVGTVTRSGAAQIPRSIEKAVSTMFTLHRYERLEITSQQDLTGTKVVSNRPIAVYSGHECGVFSSDTGNCDHMVEQLPPVNVWGRTYIAAPFLNQTAYSLVKIVASENITLINLVCRAANGSVVYNRTVGPLSSGDSHQEFVPAEEYMYISSDKPVLVVHFITSSKTDKIGGPSMITLPSATQVVRNVTFYSINSDIDPQHDFNHFVTIVVPAEYSSPTSLELDNLTLSEYDYHSTYLQTSFGDFVVYRLEVSPGYHYLHHNNPEAGFILTVYGLDRGASYGYAPGLNQAMSCERVPATAQDHKPR